MFVGVSGCLMNLSPTFTSFSSVFGSLPSCVAGTAACCGKQQYEMSVNQNSKNASQKTKTMIWKRCKA